MQKTLKVGYVPGNSKASVPLVRLSGKYLIDMGFDVGQLIDVEIEKRTITIHAVEKESKAPVQKEKLRKKSPSLQAAWKKVVAEID